MTDTVISVEVLTWSTLTRFEPHLRELEAAMRSASVRARLRSTVCANELWYGHGRPGFKAQLEQLVGWSARSPLLRSSAAYDLAYDHLYDLLYDLLPACRNCSCLPVV